MNRKLSRALKFVARTSHVFTRLSRKLFASGISFVFALSSASALFPSTVSAHAFSTVPPSPAPASVASQCSLQSARGEIKHVIYIQFDNVHFTRDNPNVPSDLEQMPHLLNFITQNGTLDTGDHAVLISHTANDILTTQTG